VQYWRYLSQVLQGDLGTSIYTRQQVTEALIIRYPNTLRLALGAVLIAASLGITAGVVAAVRRNTWFDYGSMAAALAGISIPAFWLGIMFIIFFSVRLRWFPVAGLASPWWSWMGIRSMILPALSLGIRSAALLARLTRSSMLDVLGLDYIRTARAKGLRDRVVIYKHALKNSLIPVLTVLGLNFGGLLGGTVITESVFGINGVGRLMVGGIYNRDFPLVQGGVLIIATTFVMVNLLVDLAYALVDPRIRYT